MTPPDRSLRERLTGIPEAVAAQSTKVRESHAWIDEIARALHRYVARSVGRQATVITYASYFLAFALLVVYLLLIEWLIHSSPRAERLIRNILDVGPEVDLGTAVDTTTTSSINALIGVVGVLGVVLAASATASSLRVGLDSVFGLTSPRRSLLKAPALDFSAGIWLATLMLISWVLALATFVRRGVVTDVTGASLPGTFVVSIKLGSIVLAVGMFTWVLERSFRRERGAIPTTARVVGAILAAIFIVICNYVLLFFLFAALVDPDGGGGFELALILLLWVSVVIRGVMMISCWVAVHDGVPDGAGPDVD